MKPQAFRFQHILTQNSIYSPTGVKAYYRSTRGVGVEGPRRTAIYIHTPISHLLAEACLFSQLASRISPGELGTYR